MEAMKNRSYDKPVIVFGRIKLFMLLATSLDFDNSFKVVFTMMSLKKSLFLEGTSLN